MSLLRRKKIFVTGGLGFIGSNLVRALLDAGVRVKVYDNFSSGSRTRLKRLGIFPGDPRLEVARGDILDKGRLAKAMKGFEAVVHFAAQLEITRSVKDPAFDLATNTEGTLNVLEGMRKNKINLLLNASSACVYGQKNGRELPTAEKNAAEPNWAYGVSKLAAEKYCRLYADFYGFKIISARLAIIYGQNEWYGRVMTLFIKNVLLGKPLVVFGDGMARRDFTHVDDVICFALKALKHLFSSVRRSRGFHCPLNVSTAEGTSIIQLAKKIRTLARGFFKKEAVLIRDSKVSEGEFSRFIRRMRLPGELRNMILDNREASKILRWKPSVSLREGLKRQMLWAAQNPDLWKKMSY